MSARKLRPNQRVRLGQGPCGFAEPVHDSTGLYIGSQSGLTKLTLPGLETVWTVAGMDLAPRFVQSGALVVGSSEGWYALDTEDGRRLWGPKDLGQCLQWREDLLCVKPLAVVEPRRGSITRTLVSVVGTLGDPCVCGDVVIGTSLGGVTGDPVSAVQLVDERVLWRRDLIADVERLAGGRDATRIMCAEHRVLAARTDCLAGASLDDGSIRWIQRLRVPPYRLPVIVEGRVFVLSAGEAEQARLVCLDIDTGAILYDIPQDLLSVTDKPSRGAADKERLAFATQRGLLISFDRRDGLASWWYRHEEGLCSPTFVDGSLLVQAVDGELLVFSNHAVS